MTDNNLTISTSGANIKVSDNSDLIDFQIDPALTDGNIDLRVIQNLNDPKPYAHLATNDASMMMMNTFQNIVELRQRQINHQKGLNSGNYLVPATSPVMPIEMLDQQFWIKPYYTKGSQSSKKEITGFDIQSSGMGIGYDCDIDKDRRFGVGLFYTKADLTMKSLLLETVDMQNYTALIYGSDLLKDNQTNFMYQLGYAIQQNDSKRTIDSDEYGVQTLYAGYQSHILALDLKLMRQYHLSNTLDTNPLVETTFRKYTTPAYTENGQTDLRLTLHESTNYQTIFSVGNMLEYNLEEDSRWIVDTRVGYDFKHDKNAVSTSYSSTLIPQQSISVKGIDNNGFIYKLGISYEVSQDNILFDMGYNLEGEGSAYKNHILSAKLVYKL
jgi:outer membrane autotransporter protein